jgi:hypothetical protein
MIFPSKNELREQGRAEAFRDFGDESNTELLRIKMRRCDSEIEHAQMFMLTGEVTYWRAYRSMIAELLVKAESENG